MTILFDQKTLGIIILLLLGVTVIVKRLSTGSTIDIPRGNLPVRLINAFNLFFLLVIIPGTSLLLVTGHLETVDPTHTGLLDPWIQPVWNLVGLMIYSFGHFLMGWSLICLGRNYQIGGMPPRADDKIVMDGPFRMIRHPAYAAALCIALGLFVLTQSGALFAFFAVYVILIIRLIHIEEDELMQNYTEAYILYRHKVKRLIPHVY